MNDAYSQFYPLIEIIPSILLGFITIRATCSILDLRSNRVYAVCHMLNVVANLAAHTLGIPEFFRAFVLNPSTSIIMPIAYSRGPLRSRISRTLTLCFSSVVAEIPSILTFMMLGHGAYYSQIDASNASDIALVYCITLLSASIAYETVILLCQRIDQRHEAEFETPVLAFLFVCFFLANFMVVRLTSQEHTSVLTYLSVGVALIASLAYGFLSLALTQRDVLAKRDLANNTARLRQEKHVIAQIVEVSRRNDDMRRLRHDLANQLDIVSELVAKGHTAQADQYLGALQEQASRITGRNRA